MWNSFPNPFTVVKKKLKKMHESNCKCKESEVDFFCQIVWDIEHQSLFCLPLFWLFLGGKTILRMNKPKEFLWLMSWCYTSPIRGNPWDWPKMRDRKFDSWLQMFPCDLCSMRGEKWSITKGFSPKIVLAFPANPPILNWLLQFFYTTMKLLNCWRANNQAVHWQKGKKKVCWEFIIFLEEIPDIVCHSLCNQL